VANLVNNSFDPQQVHKIKRSKHMAGQSETNVGDYINRTQEKDEPRRRVGWIYTHPQAK